MTEVLFDGPVDSKSEILQFIMAMESVVDSMQCDNPVLCSRSRLFHALINSPINTPGCNEIKLPHLIKRNGQLISANLVVETKLCKLQWHDLQPYLFKKPSETQTSSARVTLKNITLMRATIE
jgi:hypothetical protein